MAATIQHTEARRLLGLIADASCEKRLLTYSSAAKELGRNPARNARAVAQMCDLLDAASASAGVPLVALVTVREADGRINRKAWSKNVRKDVRQALLDSASHHSFTASDFARIEEALKGLNGLGNRRAWKEVRRRFPGNQLHLRLIRDYRLSQDHDAMDDLNIGTDTPTRESYGSVPRLVESARWRNGT
jgi:hypothetical protein